MTDDELSDLNCGPQRLDFDSPAARCRLGARHHRSTATATLFTLDDETGHSPVVLAAVFEKYRFEIRPPIVMVWGRASRHQGVMNIVAVRVHGIKQPHDPATVAKLAVGPSELPSKTLNLLQTAVEPRSS